MICDSDERGVSVVGSASHEEDIVDVTRLNIVGVNTACFEELFLKPSTAQNKVEEISSVHVLYKRLDDLSHSAAG